jgi:SAM-dependent methyltransferase
MRNPWLDIPLADYEAHMALPAIGQARLISDQLDLAVRTYSPSSVAIIGCSGGNGFDRLPGTGVSRVVGVDINPCYVEEARQRYAERIPGLDLHIADIQTSVSLFEPVDLIYVALVLEYVDVSRALSALRRHCKPNGVLVVLAQMAHERMTSISPSPYTTLRLLEPAMHLVVQEEFQRHATRAGFTPEGSNTILSPAGKQFCVQAFRFDCVVPPGGSSA